MDSRHLMFNICMGVFLAAHFYFLCIFVTNKRIVKQGELKAIETQLNLSLIFFSWHTLPKILFEAKC